MTPNCIEVLSVQFSCLVVSNSQQPHGLRCARPPCPSPAPGVYRSTDSVGRAGGGSCAQTRVREPLLSPSSQTLSPGKPLLGGPAGDHHWAPCIGFVWGCTLRHRPQRQLPGPILEPVIHSEESQEDKNKHGIITHVCGTCKNGTDEPIHRAGIETQT